MAENGPSPLDVAVESVQRAQLGGVPVPVEETDPFSPPPVELEAIAPKPRGRPRNPDSRRARSGVYSGKGKPASGPVKNPPIPEIKPEFPKIAPESVAQTIRQLDAIIVKLAGTAPLSPEEALSGGAVFGPVLDHYMPLLADKGALWLAPLTWVVLAYGPRAYEVLDRRQKLLAAKKAGFTPVPVDGGAPGENGRAINFPEPNTTDRARSIPANGT